MNDQDLALLALLKALAERDYHFVTPTPDTHRIVWRRPAPERGLREIFGWSRAFEAPDLEPELLSLAAAAGVLQRRGLGW